MRTFLQPSRVVGLCLSRQHVGVVRLRRAGARWQLKSFAERALPVPLFDTAVSSSAIEGVREALKELAAGLAREHIPVHVALPDPALRAAVFELEELPKSAAAQTNLVQFRFGRESSMDAAGLTVSQTLGQARAQPNARGGLAHLLFGMSIDNRWYEALQATLRGCGVVAWGVAPCALQRFNLFHDRFATSGALLSVDRVSWALSIWDERARLRHCSSCWRTPSESATNEDHEALVGEAVRVIVAYADTQPECTIEKMFVAGAAETEALATLLDRRANVPGVRLMAADLVDGCDDAFKASYTGEGALCAALSL